MMHGRQHLNTALSIDRILSTSHLSPGIVFLLNYMRDNPINMIKCAHLLGYFVGQCRTSYQSHKTLRSLTRDAKTFFGQSKLRILQQNLKDQIGCRHWAFTIWYLLLDLPADKDLLLQALPIVDPGTFAGQTSSRSSPIIVSNIDRLAREWSECPLYSFMIMSLTFFDPAKTHQEGWDHVFVCVKMNCGSNDTLIFSSWNHQSIVIARNFHTHLVAHLTSLTNIPRFYHQVFQAQDFRQHRQDHDALRVVIQRIICKKESTVEAVRHNLQVLLSKELKLTIQDGQGQRGRSKPGATQHG